MCIANTSINVLKSVMNIKSRIFYHISINIKDPTFFLTKACGWHQLGIQREHLALSSCFLVLYVYCMYPLFQLNQNFESSLFYTFTPSLLQCLSVVFVYWWKDWRGWCVLCVPVIIHFSPYCSNFPFWPFVVVLSFWLPNPKCKQHTGLRATACSSVSQRDAGWESCNQHHQIRQSYCARPERSVEIFFSPTEGQFTPLVLVLSPRSFIQSMKGEGGGGWTMYSSPLSISLWLKPLSAVTAVSSLWVARSFACSASQVTQTPSVLYTMTAVFNYKSKSMLLNCYPINSSQKADSFHPFHPYNSRIQYKTSMILMTVFAVRFSGCGVRGTTNCYAHHNYRPSNIKNSVWNGHHHRACSLYSCSQTNWFNTVVMTVNDGKDRLTTKHRGSEVMLYDVMMLRDVVMLYDDVVTFCCRCAPHNTTQNARTTQNHVFIWWELLMGSVMRERETPSLIRLPSPAPRCAVWQLCDG